MSATLDLTDQVIAVLAEHTGRPVGDAVAPRPEEERTEDDYPYSVVYGMTIPTRFMSGPINSHQADKMQRYHVVCVGLNRQQAEMLAERVRSALTAENLNVDGYVVQQVEFDDLGRTDRDTDIRPSVFLVSDTFLIWTTPGGD